MDFVYDLMLLIWYYVKAELRPWGEKSIYSNGANQRARPGKVEVVFSIKKNLQKAHSMKSACTFGK